jgi:hypothetical protein
MGMLSELKLSSLEKPLFRDPITVRREKLMSRILEQLNLIDTMKSGSVANQYRIVRRMNPETGVYEDVQTDRKVSPWWWQGSDGKWFLSIKYGTQTLELAKGKGSIQVDGLPGVERTLRLIGEATEKGELDDLLGSAGTALRKRFQR